MILLKKSLGDLEFKLQLKEVRHLGAAIGGTESFY